MALPAFGKLTASYGRVRWLKLTGGHTCPPLATKVSVYARICTRSDYLCICACTHLHVKLHPRHFLMYCLTSGK